MPNPLNCFGSVPSSLGIVVAMSLGVLPAAGGVPDYDFQWATITHPGNRAANIDEAPGLYPPLSGRAVLVGSVNHDYRIATTEVTNRQWYEFVVAAAPFYPEFSRDSAFTGYAVRRTGDGSGGFEYQLEPGLANSPAKMGWYWAARYVNWLNNNKATTRSAFETGAYNIAGAPLDDHGGFPPTRHEPGATFWIPSLDEWDKAVYYDPNRYGAGREGYWKYPNAGDQPLIADWPENGGQTDVGIPLPTSGDDPFRSLAVGSYPSVRSPWGLFDASGGVAEWLDLDPQFDSAAFPIIAGGYTYAPSGYDRLDQLGGSRSPWAPGPGLRVASGIPSPGTGVGFMVFSLVARPYHRKRTS